MSVETPGPVRAHGLLFDVAGATAQGPRSENQDAFNVASFPSSHVVAVADGMGGQRAGRVAADTALQVVLGNGTIRSLDAARYAIRAADEAVARSAGDAPQDRQGMGCALALLALAADRAGEVGWIAANVGDVRVISRSADGVVRLETRDHTPAYALWEAGEIGFDEIPDSPGANRLQRAVGHGGEADAAWIPVQAGWTYLLHSDGVTKAMRLDELGEAMALPSAAAACEAITRKVEERGPDDNYTAVVVRALRDDEGTQENATLPSPGRPHAAHAPRPDAVAEPAMARRGPFNPPDDVNHNRRSPLGAVAAVLALLALALAGYAAWTASQARGAASQAEVAALRDSLAAVSRRLPPDTAGRVPLTADSAAAAAAAPPPVAPPAAGPAPRTTAAPVNRPANRPSNRP